MKNNMNTTLEIPEGSKATIQGKVIDGKNYLVVEVESKSDMIDIEEKARIMLEKTRAEMNPEWINFKRGDVLIYSKGMDVIFVIFGEYRNVHSKYYFNCLFNSVCDGNTCWVSELFRKASDAEKAGFFKWLEKEKGLEWDGEKLVEVLKEGDFAIFWNDNTEDAIISVYKRLDDNGCYVDHLGLCWDNAIKWDGTKGQYERVLQGEI